MKKGIVFVAMLLLPVCVVIGQNAAGWLEVEKGELGFAVSFPGPYDENIVDLPTEFGVLKMHIVQFDASSDSTSLNYIYMVNYTAYPAEMFEGDFNPEGFFKGSIAGMAANMNGTVLSNETIKVGGFEGREVEIALPGETIIVAAQLILRGNRFYILMVATSTSNRPNGDITKFFGSFRLLQ
jgi:hypothetical protein